MNVLKSFVLVVGMVFAAPAFAGSCALNQLDIKSNGVSSRFTVEIADNIDERALGLMNRESMPQFTGMLFIYDRPQQVSFWMKDTLIPLDMIFIGPSGVVLRIHENAIPRDLTGIPGGNGIQYVLEINGGMAQTLNIQVGAQVRHRGA